MHIKAPGRASVENEETLIDALLHRTDFPHPVSKIELLETHISWVILTGHVAYKIKKPIKLKFLNFTTLERRKYFCDEELRLNRRWVPELYLDVVPICGSSENPEIGSCGPAIEYAVKMVQFPQSALLNTQLDAGLLNESDMDELAEMIADQHRRGRVPSSLVGEQFFHSISEAMLENFDELAAHLDKPEIRGLKSWTNKNLRKLKDTLIHRYEAGFVRECHGDLHLGNLVRLESGIVAFDCVEFSAELRDIDVISDAAFLMMDLVARQRQDLAYLFINRYLECTGDYEGMTVFGLYFVYHCLIRAKVSAIRSVERAEASDTRHDREEMTHYCAVALHWIAHRRPCLIAMHGFSGSGKTWLSHQLMSRLPAIRVRSDIERKREYGLDETDRSGSGIGSGVYSLQARSDVYKRVADMAELLLKLGQHVILDASFLRRKERHRAQALAVRLGADFKVIDTCADSAELDRRLQLRHRDAGNASEATINVLQYQYENADPLDIAERKSTIVVRTDEEVDADAVIERIRTERGP